MLSCIEIEKTDTHIRQPKYEKRDELHQIHGRTREIVYAIFYDAINERRTFMKCGNVELKHRYSMTTFSKTGEEWETSKNTRTHVSIDRNNSKIQLFGNRIK